MKKYDVAIIGAGTAGLSARREVAKKTSNYIVIDSGPLGTTCARVGCMPSKVLIQIANDFYRKNQMAEQGIEGSDSLSLNIPKALSHVRKLRDRFVKAVLEDMDSWTAEHLVQKKARFIDENTLDLEGEKIQADKIIIATGSSPIIPKPWQKYSDYFFDTDQIFEEESLPQSMAVIGTGVIGLEIGQALHRMGVDIKMIGNAKSIAGLSDPKLQDYVFQKFGEEFPLYLDGAEILGEEDNRLLVKAGEKTFKVDKVFMAVGRRPNVDNLGLENLSIEKDEKGLPVFDDISFQIKNTGIYFVGDANALAPVLHEASDQGRIAGHNAVGDDKECFQKRSLLRITFSDPNIAVVGRPYSQLKPENILVGEVSYEGQGRAIVKLKEKGLVRIYAEKESGKLLGSEIFAPEGEHLAHLLSWAISFGLSAQEVLSLPFYHPVLEEGLRTALRQIAKELPDRRDFELFRCSENPFDNA